MTTIAGVSHWRLVPVECYNKTGVVQTLHQMVALPDDQPDSNTDLRNVYVSAGDFRVLLSRFQEQAEGRNFDASKYQEIIRELQTRINARTGNPTEVHPDVAEFGQVREVVAQLMGWDPLTWPRHHNSALAVIATVAGLINQRNLLIDQINDLQEKKAT